MSFHKSLMLSTAAILMAGAASAQTMATVATDLNLRTGPGPNYQIVTVMPTASEASVEGCLADASWCKVTFNGQTGWASGDYMTAKMGEEHVALYPNRETIKVQTVTVTDDEKAAMNATALGTIGLAVGAIIGGPLAIAAGGVIGAATGAAVTPDERVVTYVTSNPVEPIYLDGEVVLGAGIPEGVVFYPVPDSDLAYMNLNGQYVLVQPNDRKIIYIQR